MDTTNTRVRFARECKGLSQRALSRRAGLASSHVGLIESGHVTAPDLRTVSALAQATGVEPAWLLFGTAPMLRDHPELDPANPQHVPLIEARLRSDAAEPRSGESSQTVDAAATPPSEPPPAELRVVRGTFSQVEG